MSGEANGNQREVTSGPTTKEYGQKDVNVQQLARKKRPFADKDQHFTENEGSHLVSEPECMAVDQPNDLSLHNANATESMSNEIHSQQHIKIPQEDEHVKINVKSSKKSRPKDSSFTFESNGQGIPSDNPLQQQQTMKQKQRSAEASKQMMYCVFGNVVAILEEYEARTNTVEAKRSNQAMPDQSRKTDEDVESIVHTQLLLFETLQRNIGTDVSQDVNQELRQKTIHWAAVRAEQNMPLTNTDKYICQLYEVLAKGKTYHEVLDEPMEAVSAETIKEFLPHIMKGKHIVTGMDQEFREDDKKTATSPKTRQSDQDGAFQMGVARIGRNNGILKAHLDRDEKMLEDEGVVDTK